MDIYVFGLGHVGLPMACWMALSGQRVYGIDINPSLIAQIKGGQIEIEEYYHGTHIKELARSQTETGMLLVSTKLTRASVEPAVFLISVGIADRPDGQKDLSPILSVIDEIGSILVSNDLIILRSTLIPGTCENVIVPRLRACGTPFRLAYCPETIIETKAFEELEGNPMILSGMDEESGQAAEQFLRSFTKQPIYRASNLRTAELSKVVQNIHRDVNIALANELGDAAACLNVDSEELRQLANVNPRVSMLSSGPGVGGYCLPNALGYLQAAIEAHPLPLAQAARHINQQRPGEIARLAFSALLALGKQAPGATVAVTGLAMKNYCADLRFSPALDLIQELEVLGLRVKAYDPLIAKRFPFQTDSLEDCLCNADCLIIAAKQEALSYDSANLHALLSPPALVIDTQHTLSQLDGAILIRI